MSLEVFDTVQLLAFFDLFTMNLIWKFYKIYYISTNFICSESKKDCSSDDDVNGIF